jgi:hypothetical protein
MAYSGFRFPGGDSRTTVIGATGSGKTTCSLWLLAHQRFDKRPWVVIDSKIEPVFDAVGLPPIEELSLSAKPPRRHGLYLLAPRPDEDDALEAFLWRLFERGNCGLYVDEAALMPGPKGAFQAILQQGRSKRIPVIACTQRPVSVERPVFSEASYYCVYRVQDKRDYKVIEGFVPADLSAPIAPYHWRWYDVAANRLLTMGPVPHPRQVAEQLRVALPPRRTYHPFSWTSRPTGRPSLKIVGGKG